MFDLFPDQEKFIQGLRVELRTHRAVLGQAATGFGKTVVGTRMAKTAFLKGKRVGWLNHRDFLIDQTSQSFNEEAIFHSYVAAGRRFNPHAPVWIGSIGTLVNRLHLVPEPDILFIDEAHHGPAATWRKIMRYWTKCRQVGLSATPWRLNGEGLDDLFTSMVCGPSVSWLIENGRLSDYKAFAPSHPDLTGVHTRAGDFVTEEVEELMNRRAVIGNMIEHYFRHANDKRAIYFCVGIAHSKKVAAMFNAAGVPAMHLDASSNSVERRAAARAFAAGEVRVLSNVDLFGEGYDLKAQAGVDVTVEAVGLARPTQSLGLHLQQIGRALRMKPHPAIILDHAGNLFRHGLPDDDREWSLKPRLKSPRKKGEAPQPSVKICKQCFAASPHTAVFCRSCGAPFPIPGRTPEEAEHDLQEVRARRTRKMEEWACHSVDELVALGKRRGYQNPFAWAAHVWTYHEASKQKRAEEQARQYRIGL